MSKRKRKRDYKAEYARRKARALREGYSLSVARGHARKGREVSIREARRYNVKPGTDPKTLLKADGKYVFGPKGVPKRRKGSIAAHMMDLQAAAQRDDGIFTWTDEDSFLEQVADIGLSEREAYSALFGSP